MKIYLENNKFFFLKISISVISKFMNVLNQSITTVFHQIKESSVINGFFYIKNSCFT